MATRTGLLRGRKVDRVRLLRRWEGMEYKESWRTGLRQQGTGPLCLGREGERIVSEQEYRLILVPPNTQSHKVSSAVSQGKPQNYGPPRSW